MDYVLTVASICCVYTILACSLNLAGGYHGTLSLCQAALWGVGAYAYAIVATRTEASPWLAMAVALPLSVVAGLLVGLPALRLRGDYFLIGTLGLGEIVNAALLNGTPLTGGPGGISAIPSLLGDARNSQFTVGHLALLGLFAVASVILCVLLERSPYGKAMAGLAEDEPASMALGRSPLAIRLTALTLSASMAGASGALYASYMSVVNPDLFTTSVSLQILAMTIIGGMGSAWGAVAGAWGVCLLPELLRFLKVPGEHTHLWQQVVYGLALVGLMAARPRGLLGKRVIA